MVGWSKDVVYLFASWFGISVTFLLVLNRLYVHIFGPWGFKNSFNRKAWSLADALVIFAWAATLHRSVDWTIYFALARQMGSNWIYDHRATFSKMRYAEAGTSWWPMYGVKAALLLLYLDIAPRSKRWFIWISGGICFVSFAVTQGIYFFGCLPVSSRWSTDPNNPDLIRCLSERFIAYYATITSLHLFTDILVFIIPFTFLKHISRDKRVSAGTVMFGLGSVSIMASVVMAVSNLINGEVDLMNTDGTSGNADLNIYAILVEQTAAICVVCTPALRKSVCNIYDRIQTWRKRASEARANSDEDVEKNVRSDSAFSQRSTESDGS